MEKIKVGDMKGSGYISLANIELSPVDRISSGCLELDWMFGFSKISEESAKWGIPMKTISLISAQNGTGKSRMASTLAKSFAERGMSVLYFQGEMPLENFVDKIQADPHIHKNFYLSEENSLDKMTAIIYDAKPNIVIIDSVNQIYEFKFCGKHSADIIIDGDETHIGLRKVCNDNNTIIILLGQLNLDGSSKGGSSLPHLVDISFNLEPCKEKKKEFKMSIWTKNRYGKKGPETIWEHRYEGCFCISNNRLEDEDWQRYKPLESNYDIIESLDFSGIGDNRDSVDFVGLDFSDLYVENIFPAKINNTNQEPVFGDSYGDKKIQLAMARSLDFPDMIPNFSTTERIRMFIEGLRLF